MKKDKLTELKEELHQIEIRAKREYLAVLIIGAVILVGTAIAALFVGSAHPV